MHQERISLFMENPHLADLVGWTCLPLAKAYWADARDTYTPSFAARVEAAFATGPDCE